ncbi:Tubulin polyglutamylase TTLL5 [Phytophthora citrophthora]|uniref:Tubulin polyglutamylase TTLL5 n=1 Tax=Phytophthora citrophthora TaxID=4793 RepID=A0AAD9LL65_9STRA|nr:Tubulin polyglutamylase TTLL5 [Phytophthora citrophthora]
MLPRRPASAVVISRRTEALRDQQDGHSSQRLEDHMDSFPLVPLPVIAQFGIKDLETVERGLNELLGTLNPHESDQQLGRYATRQMAEVQRHLTHQRAQERVFQMLRGDLAVDLKPMENTLRKSSSVATIKVNNQTSERNNGVSYWKIKKAGVEMARAMVQKKKTSVSTVNFVISVGENVRKRRKPRKRSPEEEAALRVQRMERERENRRLAAIQRLQARRELQEKKKKKEKKIFEEEKESDSDSDMSDVSNCSESDEANEKAILALEVHIPAVGGVEDSPSSERSESDDDDTSKGDDGQGPEVEQSESESGFETSRTEKPESVNSIFEIEKQEVPEDEIIPHDTVAESQQNEQEEVSGLDLGTFIASRAAAKLEQLQAEKEAREKEVNAVQEPVTIIPDTTFRPEDNFPTLSSEECENTADTTASTISNETSDAEPFESTLKDKQSWIEEVRRSAEDLRAKTPDLIEPTLSLPRSPRAEYKDYRFYFSNFHCILTSVFEQSRSSSSNPSSSSLYHRPVGSTGEHTMRLQQKLYESWQTIMQDYATVFGPKIAAPEGMVPLAAAKPWAPHYRINSTARKEVSEIVTEALQRLGGDWEDHPSGLGLKTTWNLLWTWSKPRVERQTLLAWQKVNHFQHAKALTRKDCLKKQIGKYLAAGGRLRQAFDIIPPTFILPKEYVAFVQAFQDRSEQLKRNGYSEGKNIWIMKPVALSRGRGISLVNDLSQVIYGEQVVIQEYIANPRLLDGFKFDLRLYVLVTSFNPLEAFLYDEGFVRLCTRPYEDGDLSNIFVHLTNSSIQKNNEEAIAGSTNPIASVSKETTDQKDAGGTKTTLAYLWRRLTAEGVDVEQVKRNIEEVVLKALLCGEDQIPFQVNSFDLLGYDILLDADLRPWLIEINSSPSMARDHDLDYQVKDAMMLDTLRIINPLHFDRAKVVEVIARRQQDLDDEKRRPHAHMRHPRETEELAVRQLNEDLTGILRGNLPRAYGELPENMGNYRRLCPYTTSYNQLVKLKRSCMSRRA